jgi:hypothetical protein
METPVFDLFTLCAKIHEIAPQNHVSYTGAGLILNDIEVRIEGNLATFKDTKLRFSNSYDLLKNLLLSRVLLANKEDILHIASTPSHHSHKLKKPFIPKDPNSKRTLKYNASNIKKFRDLEKGQSKVD